MRERGITIAFAVLCLLCANVAVAQSSTIISNQSEDPQTVCGSDIVHERQMLEDDAYRLRFLANEAMLQKASEGTMSENRSVSTLTIPLVVHVIHIGEAEGVGTNISDAQIQSAVVALNEDFRKMIGTNGAGAGVDSEIEFCLASVDPNGNATNGVNRINGSSVTDYAEEGIGAGLSQGASEVAVKALSIWDRNDYYNIWIVSEIENNNGGGGIQGYAYFASSTAARDGAVIMHNAFGTTGTLKSYTNLNRTATHELGHAFSLYHTFQGNSCTETNCASQGDRVCDTPPTTSNSDCSDPDCSGTQQVENYMDYTYQTCMDMFTQGQKDRMRAAIESSRAGLLTSGACSTNASSNAPVANFNTAQTDICAGSSIQFIDQSAESPTAWDWSFPEGSPATSTQQNPTVTYTTPGPKTISLIATNASGSDSFTRSAYVNVNTAISLSVSTTPASCGNQGSATVTASGGSGSYTYLWSNNMTTATASNLGFGNHTVIVTDANGCQASAVAAIAGGDGPVASTWTSTDVLCAGSANGSATVTPGGGTAPYTYQWSSGQTTATVSNLTTGMHTVTITDASGCSFSMDVQIAGPSQALSIAQTGLTNVSCGGSSDGSFSAEITGGTTPYSYHWNGAGFGSTLNPSGVAGGEYHLTVTDASGCVAERYFVIEEAAMLMASLMGGSTSCFGTTDGTISASFSGGQAPHTYHWNGAGFGATLNPQNVSAGVYTFTAVDANGCQASANIPIHQPPAIALMVSTTMSSCTNDGSATVNASGGNDGFSYLWSDSQMQTTAIATGLSGGSYTVIVTDSNGCQNSANATVASSSDLQVDESGRTNATCAGFADGQATVSASGGAAGYTYQWNDSAQQTGPTASNLSAGVYGVSVTDADGCQAGKSVVITEPDPVSSTVLLLAPDSCGLNVGAALIQAAGGTGALNVVWDDANAQQGESLSGARWGVYTADITDDNLCQGMRTIEIEDVDCQGATAINEIEAGIGMNIYPNPVYGNQFMLTLDHSSERIIDVTLLDITGQVIIAEQLEAGNISHQIHLNGGESEGVYLVQISDGTFTITERIILIR